MSGDGIAAIIAALAVLLPALGGFFVTIRKMTKDGKSRRKATSQEHALEMKEMKAIKKQLGQLVKQVTELRVRLEDDAQQRIDGA
jgi:uncharacterized protein YneF (UPF0154 family)